MSKKTLTKISRLGGGGDTAMYVRRMICFVCLAMLFGLVNHSESGAQVSELKEFPLDSLDGLITRSDVHIDRAVSSDGKGSLRITVTEPTVIRLYEVTDLDIENARLIYTARVRTEGLEGQAYLEMLCYFPGKGEFFSRSLQAPLTGTTEWTTETTPFFLRKGENPEYVKLNLVINGKGTAWIDDIHLLKGPFR